MRKAMTFEQIDASSIYENYAHLREAIHSKNCGRIGELGLYFERKSFQIDLYNKFSSLDIKCLQSWGVRI